MRSGRWLLSHPWIIVYHDHLPRNGTIKPLYLNNAIRTSHSIFLGGKEWNIGRELLLCVYFLVPGNFFFTNCRQNMQHFYNLYIDIYSQLAQSIYFNGNKARYFLSVIRLCTFQFLCRIFPLTCAAPWSLSTFTPLSGNAFRINNYSDGHKLMA